MFSTTSLAAFPSVHAPCTPLYPVQHVYDVRPCGLGTVQLQPPFAEAAARLQTNDAHATPASIFCLLDVASCDLDASGWLCDAAFDDESKQPQTPGSSEPPPPPTPRSLPHGLLCPSARRHTRSISCQADQCLNKDMYLHETAVHTVTPWSYLVDTTSFAPAHLLARRAQETSSFHSLAHKCTASWSQPCRIYKQAAVYLLSLSVPYLGTWTSPTQLLRDARILTPKILNLEPPRSSRLLSCTLLLFFFWSTCFHAAPVSSTTKRHCADYNARCSPRRRLIVTRTIELLEAASRQTLPYLASIFSSHLASLTSQATLRFSSQKNAHQDHRQSLRICKTDSGRPRADYIAHHSILPAVLQHNHSHRMYAPWARAQASLKLTIALVFLLLIKH